MYIPVCFHATMAVEKLLKSYIIGNDNEVEKSHDLNYLRETAARIDTSFDKIENDCALLNDFVPGIKYGDEIQISKQDMNKIIKSMENICDFAPIKAMRDSFHETHKFQIIGEATDTSS
jgi:HEPN domain-containing protein